VISVLIPTRGRPQQLERAVRSIRDTAVGEVEVVAYIDSDDLDSAQMAGNLGIRSIVGPRIVLSQTWDELAKVASGDILCQGNDDCIWKTRAWDLVVQKAFEEWPDRIGMVHGSDGAMQHDRFAVNPFVHRKWVETLGYFTPTFFSNDYGDTWINHLANAIGRRKFVPILIEHMHYLFGKAEVDQTTRERLARGRQDRPRLLYEAMAEVRRLDALRLERAKRAQLAKASPIWSILILTQPARATFLGKLLGVLGPQLEKRLDEVELVIRVFDKNLLLGENREIMRQAAKGRYIAFVDDDDLVPANYVEKILPLLDGIDYIGFRLQAYTDGVPMIPTFHSLQHEFWYSTEKAHFRDISHLNPMRRELALVVPMSGRKGEDFRWANAMREKGIVKTERYIDEVMYHYYYRTVRPEEMPYGVPAKPRTEKDIRLEELKVWERDLGFVNMVNRYLQQRRHEIEES